MKRPILEVSIEGVDGLLVAQDNGADRVELCLGSWRTGALSLCLRIMNI